MTKPPAQISKAVKGASAAEHQHDFYYVQRGWPETPQAWSDIEKAVYTTTSTSTPARSYSRTTGGVSPMERWKAESMQQDAWNAIAAVRAGSKRDNGLEHPAAKQSGGSTDAGSWVP